MQTREAPLSGKIDFRPAEQDLDYTYSDYAGSLLLRSGLAFLIQAPACFPAHIALASLAAIFIVVLMMVKPWAPMEEGELVRQCIFWLLVFVGSYAAIAGPPEGYEYCWFVPPCFAAAAVWAWHGPCRPDVVREAQQAFFRRYGWSARVICVPKHVFISLAILAPMFLTAETLAWIGYSFGAWFITSLVGLGFSVFIALLFRP